MISNRSQARQWTIVNNVRICAILNDILSPKQELKETRNCTKTEESDIPLVALLPDLRLEDSWSYYPKEHSSVRQTDTQLQLSTLH